MEYQLLALAVLVTSFHLGTSTYDCICHYDVQSVVHSQPDVTSEPVGYLYEFDCKPEDTLHSQPGWWAISIDHMIGYIQKGEQLAEQTCNGEIPLQDALTTTPAPKSTTSQTSSKKAPSSTTRQSTRSSGSTHQQTVTATHGVANQTGTGPNINPANSPPTSFTGLTSATINQLVNGTTTLRTVYTNSSSSTTNSGIPNPTSTVSIISVIIPNRSTSGPVLRNSTQVQRTTVTGYSPTNTEPSVTHNAAQSTLVLNTAVAFSNATSQHIVTTTMTNQNKTNSNLLNDTHTTTKGYTHISTDPSVLMEKVSTSFVTSSNQKTYSSSFIGGISTFIASLSTSRVKPSMNTEVYRIDNRTTLRPPVSVRNTTVSLPLENANSSKRSSTFVTTSNLDATTTMKSNLNAITTLKSDLNASTTFKSNLNATTTMKSNLNATTTMKSDLNTTTTFKKNLNATTTLKNNLNGTITTNNILHATSTLKIDTTPITASPAKTTPLIKSSSATRVVYTSTVQSPMVPTTDKWNTEMCPYFMLSKTIYNGSLAHPYPLVRRDEAFCYEFSVSTDNWNNARAKCKAKGGDLVVIDDESTQDLMERFLKDLRFTNDVWIGLGDGASESDWHWVDGVRDIFNQYTNWDASPARNPVYNVRRNCAVINGQTGKWGQTVCRTFVLMVARHHYICQYEIN